VQRTWRTAAAALLLAATCACTDEPVAAPDPEPSPPAPSVAELQPGAPGEDTTTRNPSEPLEEPDATHDDVAFMQMMVLHHRQALEMSALVPDRADDQRVRDVAARIEAAQGPEILVMAQWLTERSIDVPAPGANPAEYDHAQHGHAGMVGMLTPDELGELADAEGAEFDRLYLEDMVRHHEGAVEMARFVLEHGADPRVNELATGIVAEQSAEIARLEQLLVSRP